MQRRTIHIARTAYYDRIAKHWHRVTGHHGGAFKRYVLNDRILARIAGIADAAIVELGAGNGYFMPLALRRFSGQHPARLVITDQSRAQLAIAQAEFPIDGAEYLPVDVQDPLPFPDGSFQLVLASMLFNELTNTILERAARECYRVLAPGGQLVAAVPHPDLVHALARKGALTDFGHGLAAMPSAEGLRLPVARRTVATYQEILASAGFAVTLEDVLPDEKTRHAKPGLQVSHGTPLGLLIECRHG